MKAAADPGTRAVSVAREGHGKETAPVAPRFGAEAVAAPVRKSPEAEPAGPSAGLPLTLVGSACAAALALWGWRRRTAHGA